MATTLYIGSHFPMRYPTTFTQVPDDVSGRQTAALLPTATYAGLWQEKGWVTVGGIYPNNALVLGDVLDISSKCVIIAATINAKVYPTTLGFFLANTANMPSTIRGFFIGSQDSTNFRIYLRDSGAASTLLYNDAALPIGVPVTIFICFDGQSRGFYYWRDGILLKGASNAWNNPAHAITCTPLTVGAAGNPQQGDMSGVYRIRDLCVAQLPSMPINLAQMAAAYSSAPGLGLIGAVF